MVETDANALYPFEAGRAVTIPVGAGPDGTEEALVVVVDTFVVVVVTFVDVLVDVVVDTLVDVLVEVFVAEDLVAKMRLDCVLKDDQQPVTHWLHFRQGIESTIRLCEEEIRNERSDSDRCKIIRTGVDTSGTRYAYKHRNNGTFR